MIIGAGTFIEPGAMIKGPAIIGRTCQIRHNAYIRENVIIGNDCVIGNATELKNAWLFNGAQAPHYNYIGDSILGYRAHVGAGVILGGQAGVLSGKTVTNEGLRPGTVLWGTPARPLLQVLREIAIVGRMAKRSAKGPRNDKD